MLVKAPVLIVYGSRKSFGKAALGQLKSYREGNHGIPDYALENPALVADGVGFWRDYGTDNPALRHIAKVAIQVLGIPPTAAGMLYTVNASYVLPWTFAWCMNSGPTIANSSAADFVLHALQVANAVDQHSGAYGVMTEIASSQAEWPSLYTATTTSASWTGLTTTKPV